MSLSIEKPTDSNPWASGNWDHFATLTPIGKRQVFDLTEPVTQSFIANGITVHNCSEYMFLDDTACNLASLNVLKFFDADHKQFDIEALQARHPPLDDRAGNLRAHGELPLAKKSRASATSSARWVWAMRTSARC